MKYFYTLFAVFILSFFCEAQMQASHWIFGKRSHINFPFGEDVINTNFPLAFINTNMNVASINYEGSASISDVNGNLKLYSNGMDVYNYNHQKLNENRLFGNSSVSQSSIFVPYPGKYNQYLLFTINGINHIAPNNDVSQGYNLGLYYYVIDLNQNNGQGQLITPLNNRLLTRTAEKISAVFHENERDIWVITYFENKFYAYLVTENGIQPPIISQVPNFSSVRGYVANSKGYMKISPVGNKIAIAHQNDIILDLINPSIYGDGLAFYDSTNKNQEHPGKLLLYDFDKATGRVTNEKKFNYNLIYYGLEFSPDGKYLYFRYIEDIFNALLRLDVNDPSRFSTTHLYETGGFMGALNIGINGKIYVADNENYLSVIDQPNQEQTDYFVRQQPINRNGKIGLGLPNFIVDYLKEELKILNTFDGKNACVNTPLKFWVNNNQEVQNIFWDFGDGTNSTQIVPEHTYTTSGIYRITVTINGIVYSKEIIIHNPIDIPEYEMIECDTNGDGQVGYNLENFTTFLGNQAAYVSYHLTRNDAENNLNALQNLRFIGNQNSPSIWARIISIGGCISYTEIKFGLNYSTVVNQNETICKSYLAGEYLLDIDQIQLLFPHPIFIFNSHEDAENFTNQIQSNLIVSADDNTITLYIRQQNYADCDTIIRLQITLHNPTLIDLTDKALCPFLGEVFYTIPDSNSFQTIEWIGLIGDDRNQNLNSSSIRITHEGQYQIKVTNHNGCTYIENFEVTRKQALNVVIKIDQHANLVIDYLGNDPNLYLFSIDNGETWLEGTTYANLPIGTYEVLIKSKEEDGCILYHETIKNTLFNNFFSPNGDGSNDTWIINGFEKFEWLAIEIYNRYGKKIVEKRINYSNEIWDGYVNQTKASTGTYWYKITTSDQSTYTGYVLLKNQ